MRAMPPSCRKTRPTWTPTATPAEPLPVDVSGAARVAGGTLDIGATEFFLESNGDLDGDGSVGGSDLDIVRANWGQQVTAWDATLGDASGDGVVNGSDLDIVRANWGQTPTAASAVDDPATCTPEKEVARTQTTQALAEAAWAEAIEALQTKTRKKATVAAVDWVMTQMRDA